MSKKQSQKAIQVCAHWAGMESPALMGTLYAAPVRGKEVFSFEYDPAWLKSKQAQILDPELGLFEGPQYARENRDNFGVFLDSSPDRWGRVLMQRREAQKARTEERAMRPLMESDYLLGVYDGHRIGALRFRLKDDGPFLDDHTDMAAPPWTKLRELEHASLQLEQEQAEDRADYAKWLNMLIAPGSSLGGARPKASVLDEAGHPWIAKFPSRNDEINIGRWEYLVHMLAQKAGIVTAPAKIKNFSSEHDTFLNCRFDRSSNGERIHFASAMTLLAKQDGDGSETGVSYLDLAGFIMRNGAQVQKDLEQLWRRILFFVCISNTDDHLRNHGFLLTPQGWALSPAYDMNSLPTSNGLSLNITREDNSQNIELLNSVAQVFRISEERRKAIHKDVISSVREWQRLAKDLKFSAREIEMMRNAFRVADAESG